MYYAIQFYLIARSYWISEYGALYSSVNYYKNCGAELAEAESGLDMDLWSARTFDWEMSRSGKYFWLLKDCCWYTGEQRDDTASSQAMRAV